MYAGKDLQVLVREALGALGGGLTCGRDLGHPWITQMANKSPGTMYQWKPDIMRFSRVQAFFKQVERKPFIHESALNVYLTERVVERAVRGLF